MSHMRQNTRINKLIRELKLFCGCCNESVERLCHGEGVEVCSFEASSVLQSAKAGFKGIGLMLSGTALVQRESPNGLMLMSKLQKGDAFGAATILNNCQSFAPQIVCKTAVTAVFINEQVWLGLLHSDFELMQNYLAYINSRLQFLNRRLDALSQNNTENRVLSFISSSQSGGVFETDSYTEFALMLCVGRSSLYRALDALAEQGFIIREGKRITLLNPN